MALKLCRCLCVLLLSIVNKDLLFVIIESYDWRVAHEAEQHRYGGCADNQKKKLTWFSWCHFLLQSTSTDSDPLAAAGPWVDRWDSLLSLWWSAVVCVCVCSEWEMFGASLHCLQGWGFSVCGIWAACVRLSLSISVWPVVYVRYFTEPFKKSTVKRNELNQLILDNNELFCSSQWINFRVFWRSGTEQHPVTGQ